MTRILRVVLSEEAYPSRCLLSIYVILSDSIGTATFRNLTTEPSLQKKVKEKNYVHTAKGAVTDRIGSGLFPQRPWNAFRDKSSITVVRLGSWIARAQSFTTVMEDWALCGSPPTNLSRILSTLLARVTSEGMSDST